MTPRRCGRCGTRYEPAAFAALALVENLDRSAIAEHVVAWPSGSNIEVRACAHCQAPLARLAREAERR